MNYNYLKKLSIIALSLMTSVMSMMAENRISVGDFCIGKGEEKTLSIDMVSDGDVKALQFVLTLPQGMTLANDAPIKANIDNYGVTWTVVANKPNTYFVLLTSTEDDAVIPVGKSSIVTFNVATDDTYNAEEATISLGDVKGAGAVDETTGNSKVEMTVDNDGVYAGSKGIITGAVGVQGSNVAVTLSLTSAIDVCHINAIISLPEGLEVAGGDNPVFTVLAGGEVMATKMDDGRYNIIVGNTDLEPIAAGENQLVSFNLVMTEGAEPSEGVISISDVCASDNAAVGYDFAGSTISLNADIIETIKNAKEALEAAKQEFESYKTKVAESLASLREQGYDAGAADDLIAAAKTEVLTLTYNEAASLDENKARVDAVKTKLEENLYAAREHVFGVLKTTYIGHLEDIYAEAPAADELITYYNDMMAEVEALEYDSDYTMDEHWDKLKNYVTEFQKKVDNYNATHNFTAGDINEDGIVDIMDYAKLAKFIMDDDATKTLVERFNVVATTEDDAKLEAQRLFNLYNVNGEDDIEVTDLVAVVDIIINGAKNATTAKAMRAKGVTGSATISTEMVGNDLVFNLRNSAELVAIQMDVTIPGAEVTAEHLSSRATAHSLMCRDLGNETYRIMIVGMSNQSFEGTDGELFRLSLNGTAGEVEFGKVVASDAKANSYTVSVGGIATAINAISTQQSAAAIYSVAGKQMNAVGKGINIVVGADGKVRKVMK